MLNLQRKGDTGRRLETVVEAEQEDEGYEHGKQNKAQNSNDQTFPSPLHWKTSRKRGSPSGSLHLPLNFLSSTAFFLCVFFWVGGCLFLLFGLMMFSFLFTFSREYSSAIAIPFQQNMCLRSPIFLVLFKNKNKNKNKHKSASFKTPLPTPVRLPNQS